jgi:hypothetical protein
LEPFTKLLGLGIKNDIQKVVTNFYTHGHLPSDLNQTFMTLTPKQNQPNIPQDYRPFGLCNDIYKIIAKSLANRVKDHLPNYISQAQSIFISKIYISSNINITQEIDHSFNLKNWNNHVFILKVFLAKAV